MCPCFSGCLNRLEPLPIAFQVAWTALNLSLSVCVSSLTQLVHSWNVRPSLMASCLTEESLDANWLDLVNLGIQSFYNSAGAQINNTTTSPNPTILMPMQNGPAASCQKVNIWASFESIAQLNFPRWLQSPRTLASQFYIISFTSSLLRLASYVSMVPASTTTWRRGMESQTLQP